MTIVALKPEHFDILENESVSAWLTFSGAIAPGSPFLFRPNVSPIHPALRSWHGQLEVKIGIGCSGSSAEP